MKTQSPNPTNAPAAESDKATARPSFTELIDKVDYGQPKDRVECKRILEAEHAALVAVAEAAQDALAFRTESETRLEFIAREKFQAALANLAAVRGGGK